MIERLSEEQEQRLRRLFKSLDGYGFTHLRVDDLGTLLAEVEALRQERDEAREITKAAIQEAKAQARVLDDAMRLVRALLPEWSSSWPTKPGFYWYQEAPEAAIEVVVVEIVEAEGWGAHPLMRRINSKSRHVAEDQAQWAGPLAARSPEVSSD